ncbi:hypothetical protein IV203_025302 [Nitzschia inconspicua]|uniref:Uncharacterized protein n=1 Tax=Nitzschia inconspicua TaxID=303405 RepID=A0A9K3K9Y6_9STRA|nr:hypothetical protein IV203_024692 [Nitzschia inconspicua]KAG7362418.1 hypothetical protein IV203_025302 [Nitzschia inconspicua]
MLFTSTSRLVGSAFLLPAVGIFVVLSKGLNNGVLLPANAISIPSSRSMFEPKHKRLHPTFGDDCASLGGACSSVSSRTHFPISLRGGDMVIRSNRRYAPVRGIHMVCASVLILAVPSISFRIIQVAAFAVLVSSVLQYTNGKGFL